MNKNNFQDNLSTHLLPTANIDSGNPKILSKATEIVRGCTSEVEKAKALYEFVRDSYTKEAVDSYIASDILYCGGNLCYQRAILLTALCRAAGIPARLHFQKVDIKDWFHSPGDQPKDVSFAHGLVGIFLNGSWHIYEPTGNSYKWFQITGDEKEAAEMVVEFDPDKDCLFDMSKNARVSGELLPLHFADWTKELEEMTDRMNKF